MEFLDKNKKLRSLTIATDGTPSLDGLPLLIDTLYDTARSCGMSVSEFTDVLEELGNFYFGGNTCRTREMIEGYWNWLDRAEWVHDTDYVENNEDYEEDDDDEDNDYDNDVCEDEEQPVTHHSDYDGMLRELTYSNSREIIRNLNV